jgi:hypothetical protein
MARIYSWQLTDTKYAYITGINNDEPFVGNRLKTEDYEIVTDKVDSMSATQYSANFDKLCVLCNQYGLDPTKEGTVSAMAFYDTTNLNSNFMVVLVGKDGKDGAKGDKGDKGDPGEPGVTPDTPIPYISVTAYNSTGNRDIRPDTPKEGDIIIQWNPNTKQYTFSDKQGEWYLYDSDANDNDGDGSDKSIIWQSSAVYNDKGIVSPWTKPIRITGENGEPGTDGNNLEFIYTRRTFPMIDEDAPISVNKNKDVPDGWTGSPTGIDDKWKYEYMCQRRKDANDKWGPWEGPTVWSRWGDDGKDGDGVEYVYYTTNGQEPNFRCEDTIESEAYQKTEYRPIVQLRTGANDTWADVMDNEGNPVKWYDNPRQIDAEDNRAQWVLIRKRRTPEEGGKAQWGQFEGPSLWSMYGEKGDQGIEGLNVYERKLYQSYNANDAPHYIRDTFSQAFPWAPAIPVEKGEGEAIWCIEAYIKLDTKTKEQVLCWYDGSVGEQVVNQETGETDVPHWSVPYIIEGRDGADRVHSEEKIYKCVALGENGELVPPPIPEENHKDEDYYIPSGEGWTQYPIGLSNATPVCYFCYRTRDYREWWGEWSDWEGPFLHTQLGSEGPAGIDGTDGKDGDGVEYVYARTTDGDAPECHIPPGDYDDGTYQGDEYKPYRDADYTLRWSDEPQGVDEVNCYEWVMSRSRTYDETDEVVKWSEFSTPGIFAKYGFNGKDGKDIEYVYALTKTSTKPGVVDYGYSDFTIEDHTDEFYPQVKWNGSPATVNENKDDVKGTNKDGKIYWMDNAADVTVDWPYQWEMIRKKTGVPQEDNVNLYDYPWSEYTDDIVTLHSKWGRDGDQGRQGVAGVAGITYEMRYMRARHGVDPTTGLENDDIYLFVPNIVNGEFGAEDDNNSTPIFREVLYVNEEGVEQDAWKQYWYNTIHPGTNTPLYKTRNLHKDYFPLYTDALSAEKEYPYMFFIQSRIIEDRVEETWVNPNNNQTEVSGYTSVEILENGEWEAPARLTGKQGIQGPRGNRGPILFSAGVYGMGKKYYTDDVRKPYVLDPADKEYYYLETGNYSPGATVNGVKDDKDMEFWYAYPDGNQHSKDNIPSKDSITDDPHWVKMEQFDVILANVGIFNSALVGSGVFYGDWFYSQNGTINGNPSTEYEKFLDVRTSINSDGNLVIEYDDGTFIPNMAFNLKDGSGWLANKNISWGSNGNVYVNGEIQIGADTAENLFKKLDKSISGLEDDIEAIDIGWLKNAFNSGKTVLSNGLVLSTFIAVSGSTGPESGLNSSTKIKSGRTGYSNKKLVFFAGSNGLKTSAGGSTNISDSSSVGYTSNPKIEFFSDGSGYVAGDKFKWDENGKATIQNLTIKNSNVEGSYRSPFKHVDSAWNWGSDDPDVQEQYDNLYCSIGGGSWIQSIPWIWGEENIGRHVTLVHNKGGNNITDYGSCSISAPSGYCFFEDGISRKELQFSNEIIDLIGYGDEDENFHGWIVNKRDNIMTKSKYGHNLKCLCFGNVSFASDGSASLSNLKTFDGTTNSSSYHTSQRFSISGGANSCTITMPVCWFNGGANGRLHVELTPVYNTRIPQVALGSIYNNSFTVHVDKYPAAFNFMLYNKNDWFTFSDKFAYDKIVYLENANTYRSMWFPNVADRTKSIDGFTSNASCGLTVTYISGDASWVNYYLSGGTLHASTISGNSSSSSRTCIVRVEPKGLDSNEVKKSDIPTYIDITLAQSGTPTGGGGWT